MKRKPESRGRSIILVKNPSGTEKQRTIGGEEGKKITKKPEKGEWDR